MVTRDVSDSRAAHEPQVDDLDNDVPTKEEFLHHLREALRQSLAGDTRPIEELFEEIRREEAAEAEAD